MSTHQQHPLSAAYPSMSADEFAGLVADIRQHGQRDPATILDGMVLDGWHRYLACVEIGIPCRFVDFSGTDPASFVISKNGHRRQLTEAQRAAAVVSARAWRPATEAGVAPIRGGDCSHPTVTVKQMAVEAGVSERSIQRAKKAHDAGLTDQLRDGKISLAAAAQQVDGKRPGKKAQPVEVRDDDPSDAEIAAAEAQDQADRDLIDKLIQADDKFAAAVAECKRLQAIVTAQDGRIRGLMNELNAAKRAAEGWRRKAEKVA